VQHQTDASVELSVQQFLDDWHYRLMHSSLGKDWTRYKVVDSALQMLAHNGVDLTPQDIKHMLTLEESHMVSDLVYRMPEHVRDNFEHITLEFQMLATTSARFRSVLDSGNEQAIQEIAEEADSTSIGQEVLRRAVLQAAEDSAHIQRCKGTWVGNMELRVSRLQRSTEIAEETQAKLLVLESQLAGFGSVSRQKANNVLMGFASANEQTFLRGALIAWVGVHQKERGGRQIRDKFDAQIANCERKLAEFTAKTLANVRNVLFRSSAADDADVLSAAVGIWKQEVDQNKAAIETAKQVAELQSKVLKIVDDRKVKVKLVMERWASDQEALFVPLVFDGWLRFSAEYKKDAEVNDAVKAAERKILVMMQQKKAGAISVLTSLYSSCESGLLDMVFTTWLAALGPGKSVLELERAVAGAPARLKMLSLNQRGTAAGVQGRVNEQMDLNILSQIMTLWQGESKLHRVHKYYTAKIDSKRKQLSSVQTLFRSFAGDLESGLKDLEGGDTNRGSRPRRRMSKSLSGVTLPSIHA